MQTIPEPRPAVQRPMALRQYAACLATYAATITDPSGTVHGTARELYAHGGLWLEWRGSRYYERVLLRRNDPHLSLGEVVS